jgi:hypothetical protein
MMNMVNESKECFVVHQPVGPVEVSVMRDYNHNEANAKVDPAVVLDIEIDGLKAVDVSVVRRSDRTAVDTYS